MKPIQSPAYTNAAKYTPRHSVPGHGLCPACGQFAGAYCSHERDGIRVQHRACNCGERFKSVIAR